jgi:hypothetical protein
MSSGFASNLSIWIHGAVFTVIVLLHAGEVIVAPATVDILQLAVNVPGFG